MPSRAVALLVALLLGIALMFLTIVALSLFGVRDNTLARLGAAFAAPLAGLLLAAWRKPAIFAGPLSRIPSWLNAHFKTKTQRALLLFGSLAPIPWFALRVVGETFETSSIRDYVREAYFPLLNTVFPIHAWSYEPAWYDWSMLLAVFAVGLALLWRPLVVPVLKWVQGGNE